ncbi:hypothetical protein C0Q70_11814 [Pomacea canaliculata]|uniref:Uncharacterized protein n=1 Tax=Pomacea canaliculata TaxID=400727 RepID=A0A2T7P715_POMCA|nr:hypothetical protein C0Q70_11814 [Pomacea canaliculata]
MTCLRSNSGREREYDEVFAQILDAVSGKHEIAHLPRVNPLPMEKDRVTPFIAFKKSCKPVDPDHGEGAHTVIDICTNRTITFARVYLMLNSEKHVDVLTEPSVMCHCTLQADSSITLYALDVRLQNSSNNQCGASSLEFKSEEKSVELKCQDRPLFGLETLFEGKEINLTLHTDYAPKMVWIDGKADSGKSTLNTIMVSCRTELEVKKIDEKPGENNNEGITELYLSYNSRVKTI